MAREMLSDDPTQIGLQLWDGTRKVAEEWKRAGASRVAQFYGWSHHRAGWAPPNPLITG
jgi:hypothetical protein